MESNREAKVRVKEVRRTPQEEKPSLGTRLKKRLSKKQRGEFKIRVTSTKGSSGLEKVHTWIWNHYRDEDAVRGALMNLERKYSFYFLEVLNPEDQVIVDNKEAYEERRRRDLSRYSIRSIEDWPL